MRILLAVDSMDVADIAVQHFRRHPWPAGSTVEVLCVIDKTDLSNVPQLLEDLAERAVELGHYTAAKIGELGISSLAMVLSGNPKDVIVDHAAETGADRVILTLSNPRTEDPGQILDDLLAGFHRPGKVRVEPDRQLAIEAALTDARSGDVVLVTGKGRHTYQIFADRVTPFDDAVESADHG